jgi:hypothetical protein
MSEKDISNRGPTQRTPHPETAVLPDTVDDDDVVFRDVFSKPWDISAAKTVLSQSGPERIHRKRKVLQEIRGRRV